MHRKHLCRNAAAVGSIDRNPFPTCRNSHLRLGKRAIAVSRRIVDHDGLPFGTGIEQRCDSPRGRLSHVGKTTLGNQIVIPRKFVSARNACTGQVIVELMPDETPPFLVKRLFRIIKCSEVVGYHTATLGSIGQLYATSVETFEFRMGRITTRTVNVHQ